jgi:type IV pilus assembly protein PilC
MFADFGGEDSLPGPRSWSSAISEGFLNNWYIFFAIILAIVFGVPWTYRHAVGPRFWHKHDPPGAAHRPVMRKIAVARFTRTLGTLLSLGRRPSSTP